MTNQSPRSCVVHGPTGCGKTIKAQVMAKALGLSKILDNWDAKPAPLLDTLALTSVDNPFWDFKVRVLAIDQAKELAEHEGRQA